jgi:hypothetical protein
MVLPRHRSPNERTVGQLDYSPIGVHQAMDAPVTPLWGSQWHSSLWPNLEFPLDSARAQMFGCVPPEGESPQSAPTHPPCPISDIPRRRARSFHGQLRGLKWLEFPYGFIPMYPYNPTVPGAAKQKLLDVTKALINRRKFQFADRAQSCTSYEIGHRPNPCQKTLTWCKQF